MSIAHLILLHLYFSQDFKLVCAGIERLKKVELVDDKRSQFCPGDYHTMQVTNLQ